MKKKNILDALEYLDTLIGDNLKLKQAVLDLTEFADSLVDSKKAPSKKNINFTPSDFSVPAEAKKIQAYTIYSDGACRGNPGVGAWGVVGQDPEGSVIFEKSEYHEMTTNNRMELLGATKALELMIRHLASEKMPQSTAVILYSDSKYVVDGYASWMPGWKARGWKKADKKEPENLDLWKNLDFISQKFKNLKLAWVKGHSGHPQNERCDQLANEILDCEMSKNK